MRVVIFRLKGQVLIRNFYDDINFSSAVQIEFGPDFVKSVTDLCSQNNSHEIAHWGGYALSSLCSSQPGVNIDGFYFIFNYK